MDYRRFSAQLITGTRPRDPVTAVRRILAVQGQDPRGARLAVRARTLSVSRSDIDRALTEDRSLLITWLNRGTLHLVSAEDYGWLHALTTPPLVNANARRLHQEGVSVEQADGAARAIAKAVKKHGPHTRVQLKDLVDRIGVRTDGQALIHILFRASLLGHVIRGPMIGKQHAYVHAADWLGQNKSVSQSVDRNVALAELGRRYLAGHAPASDRDLAYWSGLPLRDARAALSAISTELVDVGEGRVVLKKQRLHRDVPPPRFLGSFDPILHGWASRAWVTGEHDAGIIRGGLFLPSILMDGHVHGTWAWNGKKVTVTTFSPMPHHHQSEIDAEARAVQDFLS